MRFAPIVSILVACLALNAETIQGKVVRLVLSDALDCGRFHQGCWSLALAATDVLIDRDTYKES